MHWVVFACWNDPAVRVLLQYYGVVTCGLRHTSEQGVGRRHPGRKTEQRSDQHPLSKHREPRTRMDRVP